MERKNLGIRTIALRVIFILFILTLFLSVSFTVWWCIDKNDMLTLQGEVEATTYDISSKVTGRILKLHVKKGDIVTKGQVIAELDTPELKYKVHQAEAALKAAEAAKLELDNGTRSEELLMAESALNQAQIDSDLAYKTFQRYNNLYETRAVSKQSLDEAKANYEAKVKAVAIAKDKFRMLKNGAREEDRLKAIENVNLARASLQEAQSYLDEAIVRAQSNGEVTDTYAEEGELINAGYPIIEIVDMNDSYVVFNIREDLLQSLAIGTSFEVRIPAIKNQIQTVKTYYISVLGDYSTWRATKVRGDFDLKTFELRARFEKRDENLRSGMSAIFELNSKNTIKAK